MKISIVTPSYNQASYLEATLRSVIDQNFADLEYVVMDGGSTDGSVEIIKKYEDRINFWVSEPDNGQYNAINKGFSKTTGDIMGWLNSSDTYYPWTSETVSEIFTDVPEAKWISGRASHFDINPAPHAVGNELRNWYDFLSGRCILQQESLFWRRSLWEKAGGQLNEALRYAADTELLFRFFKLAPLYNVDTILGGFRFHDERRGESAGKYRAEVQEILQRYRTEASRCDLRRAALVSRFEGPIGRVLRRGLQKYAKLWSWDRHWRVSRDFNAHLWVVQE